MAKSRFQQFAAQVAALINQADAVSGVSAVVDMCPESRLEQLSGKMCTVTPVRMESTPETRAECVMVMTVAVLLVAPAQATDIEGLLGEADAIVSALEANALPYAALGNLDFSPPDDSAWLEDGLFLAAINTSWRVWQVEDVDTDTTEAAG